MTMADSDLQQKVARFQRADVPIGVSRLIGANAADERFDPLDKRVSVRTEPTR